MKGGWWGAVACVLLVSSFGNVATAALVVNGRAVSLTPSSRLEGGALLVPVLAFAPLVGIEATTRGDAILLRWSGGRAELGASSVRTIGATAFAPLDDLVRRVAGSVRRDGGDTYVDVPVARLLELSPDAAGLVVRLDRFAPTSVTDAGGVHAVRLSNCRADLDAATVSFGPADIGRATVVAAEGPSCEVRVTFLEVAELAVRTSDLETSYSLLLTPSETDTFVASAELGAGLSCVEVATSIRGRPVQAASVRIESWRNRVDVRPLLATSGSTTPTFAETAGASGACVAVSSRSGSSPGVVVIDGVPYSLAADAPPTLSFDMLEMLVPLRTGFVAAASTPIGRILLDGVNRSLGSDELVGYPPGYSGPIARGFPDRFLVVRIRDGRIVSILDEPFVVADPSATLLVASAAACARLDGLALGDPVELVCETTPERRLVVDAVSIDGLLVWDGLPGPLGDPARTWSLVGTDWQGGLLFGRVAGDTALSGEDVVSTLSLLGTPPRDVVALERDGAAALELSWANYRARWGNDGPVSVGLGAIFK